jgi:large subunit ribosomal protein L21
MSSGCTEIREPSPAAGALRQGRRCATETGPLKQRRALLKGWRKGEEFAVYAIVRCGGRQEKASVDDVLTVDKLTGAVGDSVTLPAVLVVDDGTVVSDPAEVGRWEVTAEILGPFAGPKINMILYKNKTGYRRRLGHRQKYTQIKITGISSGGAAKPAAKKSTAKAAAGKKG